VEEIIRERSRKVKAKKIFTEAIVSTPAFV